MKHKRLKDKKIRRDLGWFRYFPNKWQIFKKNTAKEMHGDHRDKSTQ
jgi:hypothetical protein